MTTKIPMYTSGVQVIVTDPVDEHFADMTGVVTGNEFREYLNEYIYYVMLDNDGYEMEFEANELAVDLT